MTTKNQQWLRRPGPAPGALLALCMGMGLAGCTGGGMTQIDPPDIDLPPEESEPRTAIMTEMEQGLVLCGSPRVWSTDSGPAKDAADDGSEEQVSRAGSPGRGPCWQVGVTAGLTTWDQPNDTAAGDRALFQMEAPGAPVSSSTDDTAASAALSVGAAFPGLATPLAGGVVVPEAAAIVQQTGDFEAATTVRSGNRAVRSISTFEPDPAFGISVGAGYYRGPWAVIPYASLMRQDIDVTIVSQRLLGDQPVDQATARKSETDTYPCAGLKALVRLKRTLKSDQPVGPSLGLRGEWCDLNDAGYGTLGVYYNQPL